MGDVSLLTLVVVKDALASAAGLSAFITLFFPFDDVAFITVRPGVI